VLGFRFGWHVKAFVGRQNLIGYGISRLERALANIIILKSFDVMVTLNSIVVDNFHLVPQKLLVRMPCLPQDQEAVHQRLASGTRQNFQA
jgi:hypothetical protein